MTTVAGTIGGVLGGQTDSIRKALAADNDPSTRAASLFGLGRQIKEITSQANDIRESHKSMLDLENTDIDPLDIITERSLGLTVEEIQDMSAEQLDEIYTVEDHLVELSLKFKDPEKKELLRRDFLLMLKEGEESQRLLDEQLKELDKIFIEHRDEYKKMLAEYGDFNGYMENTIRAQYETAEGTQKEIIGKILDTYGQALSLEHIIEHYKNNYAVNTFNEYRRSHLAVNVLTRFNRNMRKIGFRRDVTEFADLELKLDAKYYPYRDLFVYSIIKYYAYKKDLGKVDAVFLTSLVNNIIDLRAGGNTTDTHPSYNERIATFKQSMQNVLDTLIPN